MKVIIEYLENPTDNKSQGWCVTHGDKYADGIGYDEMLGIVTAFTMPEKRPCLHWLKTEEQHQACKVVSKH